jgi:hypothetical protein
MEQVLSIDELNAKTKPSEESVTITVFPPKFDFRSKRFLKQAISTLL